MRRLMTIVAFLVLVGLPGIAKAGSYTGKVTNLVVGGPIVYFNIVGATYALCAGNSRYIIDTSSVFGKNAYAMLLAAILAGKNVSVNSTGACTLMGGHDAEDVNNVWISS